MSDRMRYWDENPLRWKRDYVIKTVEEYNELVLAIEEDHSWFDKFISLCRHYCMQEEMGGCLHIVLEDGNLGDQHIIWCEGFAHGRQDHEAFDLASLMLCMTEEQRQRVYKEL